MVLGFNHNLIYKGEVFHVQTEDSGVANPHIITLLYRGGVIISSKKTSYSDILKMENLEVVVEELMKEQHKEMMRRLKSGEYDEKAFSFKPQLIENYEIPTLEADPIADIFSSAPSTGASSKVNVSMLFDLSPRSDEKDSDKSDEIDAKNKTVNLDDAILSFFGSRGN
ncbi:MAG: hypothetical protein PHN84_05770 [Desulfuromonadaceae bacterium]|nr:hypothetical protein [Desulfuromonadaceae bacterium]MDD2856877.1 hypothetical protein [Desulfuromonadaceae bacterium]